MTTVERESWPPELESSEQQIRDRIRIFAPGQWVAQMDKNIVGATFAQRITQSLLEQTPKQFDSLTDRGTFMRTHRPDGEIYQLVGVGVCTACRGFRIGRQLVDRQLKHARSLEGVHRIIGFTRPDRYQDYASLSIDEYLQLRRDDGRLVDPTIAFHLESGAVLVSVHAGFRPADVPAQGYGVLIEYPV